MKILVNATACRVAGGRSVAINFLRSFAAGDFPHEMVAYTPAGEDFETLASPRLRIEVAPAFVHRGFARLWTDWIWFRGVIAREKPDLLFAMGNIACPTRLPQVVLLQWAYAVYREREIWERMSLRERLNRRLRIRAFGRRARYATCFVTQTATVRARLERVWGVTGARVVPNAVSLPAEGRSGPPAVPAAAALPEGHRALLCLTRYYSHKNLEVLLPVAREIRDRGWPWVIWTTVSPADDRNAGPWLDRVREEGLEDVIVNLGTVPMEEIPALYGASDGLLLPTLLESFSGTYVEAMHYARPVFTSDRDFARDVCGDAAWYFDPLDPVAIVDTLERAFDRPDELARAVEAGRHRCRQLPDWPEATRRYVALFEEILATAAARGR